MHGGLGWWFGSLGIHQFINLPILLNSKKDKNKYKNFLERVGKRNVFWKHNESRPFHTTFRRLIWQTNRPPKPKMPAYQLKQFSRMHKSVFQDFSFSVKKPKAVPLPSSPGLCSKTLHRLWFLVASLEWSRLGSVSHQTSQDKGIRQALFWLFENCSRCPLPALLWMSP